MKNMESIGDLGKALGIDLHPVERIQSCPKHGDYPSRRFIIREGGNEHWTQCKKCCEEQKAEESAREITRKATEQAKQHEERLNRAGIPFRFRTRTLASFVAETPRQRHALAIAQDFADNFRDRHDTGANLIFAGGVGTGKSHLALGIAQAIMPSWTAIYVTASELVMRLRETWRRDSVISEVELQMEFARTHLLIIDEVGVQYGTDAERTQLFGVIDARYREQKPSIFLTNLDRDGFEIYLGQRSFDRLREGGIWVPFTWESYRGKLTASATAAV